MAEGPTVGYWRFRGIAEPIRFLLHFKGVRFNDKRYTSMEEWHKDKFSLGLDFPNLPYFIDGDVKITQSTAILRHLARKYHLDGETEEEKIRLSMVEQQIVDFRKAFISLCLSKDFENEKPGFVKNAPAQLKLFEAFLGDRKYMVGDKITYVDFVAYETFDFYRLFVPNILDAFPILKNYQERIKKLPELTKYFDSPAYIGWPIVGPMFKFGGGGEEPKQ